MAYNKIQKKIIKTIVEFKSNNTDVLFRDLFEEILEKNYKNVGIFITKNEIFIHSKNFSEDKNKIYELFFLFEFLKKNNLFRFIKTKKIIDNYRENYSYNLYNHDDTIKINLEVSTVRMIYYNLYSDFYISNELKEIKQSKFLTNEEKNLKIAILALWITIGTSLIGVASTFYIACNITTVIEFKNPEQLKNASSTTIINMGKK